MMMVESDSMLLSPRLADVSKLLALRICTQDESSTSRYTLLNGER